MCDIQSEMWMDPKYIVVDGHVTYNTLTNTVLTLCLDTKGQLLECYSYVKHTSLLDTCYLTTVHCGPRVWAIKTGHYIIGDSLSSVNQLSQLLHYCEEN